MESLGVEVRGLNDLDKIILNVSEECLKEASRTLDIWAEGCRGYICPQIEGFQLGDYIIAKVWIPAKERNTIAIGTMGDIFKIWADLSEEETGDLNYFCPFRVPDNYDLGEAKWSCESDEYGPHVRILIPRKTNV